MSSHPRKESTWFLVIFLCAVPIAFALAAVLGVIGGR